ncbi:M16 family metallopeptidase [Fodinicurvata fenggangensis]|uniref:M16 family metallopeptidase n=1 Tax=Fodinicurvata fenggangensis TaxID=1121830 RepID=UPI000479C8F9|nr:pitrilysin family protein [Fodinicurvata fenggangensis]
MMARFRSLPQLVSTLLLGLLLCLATPLAARAMDIQKVVSPGGIEAWLVEDHSNPVLAVEFAFRGGSATDPEGKEGLAGLTAALLDEGAGELDSTAFQEALDNRSIRMSFNTSRDRFSGSLMTLTRNRDEAFDYLRMALTEPRFDDSAVQRLKSQYQVMQARRLQDPQSLAWNGLYRLLFPDHPYGRPSEGTPESIGAVEVADMRAFLENQLARERLYIAATGDITPKELGELLDETFGSLPEEGTATEVPDTTPHSAGGVAVVEREQPQSVVAFGQPGMARDDPDFFAAYIVNYILGGGSFASRLNEEIRQERGLVYSVSTGLNTMDHAAVLTGGLATQNARVAESLAVLRAEWQRLAEEGPTEEELANAKSYVTGAFARQLNSSDSIASVLLSIQMDNLGIDYIDRRTEEIDAVSMEDVRRVASALLQPEALSFVVVGQPEGVESDLVLPPRE